MDFNPHYYEILGVDNEASSQAIEHVYKNLQRAYHPDMHPENRAFYTEKIKVINEAYEMLGNPSKREEYDRLLTEHQKSHASINAYMEDEEQVRPQVEYCSGCGRQVEALVVTCPHCGAWVSAGNWWEKKRDYEHFRSVIRYDAIKRNGIKFVKNGANVIGASVSRMIRSVSR